MHLNSCILVTMPSMKSGGACLGHRCTFFIHLSSMQGIVIVALVAMFLYT
jgi:hypothetical protein